MSGKMQRFSIYSQHISHHMRVLMCKEHISNCDFKKLTDMIKKFGPVSSSLAHPQRGLVRVYIVISLPIICQHVVYRGVSFFLFRVYFDWRGCTGYRFADERKF